jgi:poly-gamma-glutamate capsule biosynthesis protein CapA/YwtB (metallophosphatase superfamily)
MRPGKRRFIKKLPFLFFMLLCFIAWDMLGDLAEKTEAPQEVIPVNTANNQSNQREITLVAVGDCLMHNTQIWAGEQSDGQYNFDGFFADIKPFITQADYSSTCFEAPMAGPAAGYSGYPLFNSPDAMANTFANTGFDLISVANNHIFDQGYTGAMRTLEVLRGAGLDTIGAYTTPEESRDFLIKNINDIRVGYLAYSYGTNGMPVPADKSYCFNFLDEERILQDIASLRPQVDVLILILHWGNEYMPEPDIQQTEMAHNLLQAGADIILGSHPHVIQPMEIVRVGEQNKLVIYSMGNFVSNQIGLERNSGVILNIKFRKDLNTGSTKLAEVSYIPTYCHTYIVNGKRNFRVVSVEKALDDIRQGRDPYFSDQDITMLEQVLKSTQSQLGAEFIADTPI